MSPPHESLTKHFPEEAVLARHLTVRRVAAGPHTLDLRLAEQPGAPLVITFEPMSTRGAAPRDRNREGWGFSWLASKGYSVLAVKPGRNDWYREPLLRALFGRLQEEECFASFTHVIFYGGSMGGFGALAFATAAPRATVLAFCPQTTLDPARVPWEVRFPKARALDWSGTFADGADIAGRGITAYLVYDPHETLDRKHADRLAFDGVTHLALPYTGHGTPGHLAKMGALKEVFQLAATHRLSRETFAPLARRRKQIADYWLSLAKAQRRPALRRLMLERGIAIDPGLPGCRLALARLHLAQGAPGEAERIARDLVAQFPENPEGLGVLADALAAGGRAEEALASAEEATRCAPADPRAALRLARICLSLGRVAEARIAAQAALERAELWPGIAAAARRMLMTLETGHSAGAGERPRAATAQAATSDSPTSLVPLKAEAAEDGQARCKS